MRFSSRPSTSVLGSLRSLPLAVTGTVSMAAGATPETRSLSESWSRTSPATPASKYSARSEFVGPNCCWPEASEPLACTCTSTWPRFFRASTRRELVRVSPVVKEAEKSMVASIRPSTTRMVWVRRRGRLRAAIRKETRLRRAERPRITAAAPKTARRIHTSCCVGTPKSSSTSPSLPVRLVARDAAVAHADRAVCPGRDRGVVGDQDEGLLLPLVHRDQEVHDPLRGLRVEGAGRFVGPDYGRVVHERAGDGNALLLAAAHLGRTFLGLVRKPHHLQGVLRPLAGLRRLAAGDQERKLDVLDRGEDRDQVVGLEDEAHLLGPKARPPPVGHALYGLAVHVDLAVGEVVEPGEDVQQRGLPRSGRPHDGDHLPAPDPEVHPPERPHPQSAGGVHLLYARGLNHELRRVLLHETSSSLRQNRPSPSQHDSLLCRIQSTQ